MNILLAECILGCLLFGAFIIASILINQTAWISEYPQAVQKRYIELHPDFHLSEPEGLSPSVIAKKLAACLIFILLLSGMVHAAGAESFMQGCLFCYVIWFTVNAFDTFILDLGVMVHWKKCRLPGTEDMDREYRQLIPKGLLDGVFGCLIGIPVSLIVGAVIFLILR